MSVMIGTEVQRSHTKSVEWYTPEWIFTLLDIDFDLDPASPHDFMSQVPAKTKFTVLDDGMSRPWHGRVWLNPPYGKSTPLWVERMVKHGNGIALLFSRTDAKWCQKAMVAADGILFLSGRIKFIPGRENSHKKGEAGAGAGSVMFAFGDDCAIALQKMKHLGYYIGK